MDVKDWDNFPSFNPFSKTPQKYSHNVIYSDENVFALDNPTSRLTHAASIDAMLVFTTSDGVVTRNPINQPGARGRSIKFSWWSFQDATFSSAPSIFTAFSVHILVISYRNTKHFCKTSMLKINKNKIKKSLKSNEWEKRDSDERVVFWEEVQFTDDHLMKGCIFCLFVCPKCWPMTILVIGLLRG